MTLPLVHFALPLQIIVLGAITGTAYSLFAMGLSLAYQSTRVINFAQGALGAVPALFVASRVVDHGWSYWVALPVALLLAAATGALMEFLIIRRLAHSPRLVVLVATIAVAQLLLIPGQFMVNLNHTKLGSTPYPVPLHHLWKIGTVELTGGEMLTLIMAPLIAVALTFFMRRTSVGMASRAVAENREVAELAGVPVGRVSLVVWATAGLLAGAAGILLGPSQPVLAGLFGGGTGAISNDSDLLLRGLGAAMMGGLVSLPQVFVAGVALGVVEAVVQWNYPTGGAVDLVLVALIIGSLLLRGDLRQLARGAEESSWSLSGAVRPLGERIRRLPRVRAAHAGVVAIALALALVIPWAAGPSQRVLYSAIAIYIMISLSLVILTGFAGQVSLGQFAFVGLGALVGGRMEQLGYPVFGGIVFAVAAGAAAAFVVGLPALRLRGLFLAVTTLAFAVLVDGTLTQWNWLVSSAGSGSESLLRPVGHGINLNDELTFYYVILAVTIVIALIVYQARRTGVGRKFIAVRDNEPMAASLGVGPAATKLTAFMVSGCLAAVAGYLYGMLLIDFSGSVTDPSLSLTIMTMVIIGGATSVTGGILGALYIRGVPYFVHSPAILLFSSGGGLLLVILLFPAGLSTVAFWVRDRVVGFLAPEAVEAERVVERVAGPVMLQPRVGPPTPVAAGGAPALEARNVTKRFGGVTALVNASLYAAPGEILGLMGPNGAGKTTLFDVLNGLTAPDSGLVFVHGEEVTGLSPQARARLGLGRSFQQARLFDELTVREVLMVALEREAPTELVPSLLALPPSWAAERRKRLRADELLELLGLTALAERRATELSTGTRRIVELGCTVALGADVVLLDEPTAGIAQREVEAFTPVLRQLRDYLDATVIVVAHDVPLIVGLVDRLYVLESGQIIAEGPPRLLTEDPRVIAAYLGDDEGAALIPRGPALAPRRPRPPRPRQPVLTGRKQP